MCDSITVTVTIPAELEERLSDYIVQMLLAHEKRVESAATSKQRNRDKLERNRRILDMRGDEDSPLMALAEIGKAVGLSKDRVRHILIDARQGKRV